MANLPFLTPAFTYNQALHIIFNAFIKIYMYIISELHRNDLGHIFSLASRGRVKMAQMKKRRIFAKNSQFAIFDP